MYRGIAASRCNALAIWCPCHCVDPICMASIGKRLLHGERDILFYLPYLHCPIVTSPGDILLVGRPCERSCPCLRFEGVTIGPHMVTGRSIPDVEGVIRSARDE